ncbi:MAG TPA: ECF transporter S component [Actinomycetota bacterium]|nr:ECF transporter S component [Actinomycetota bacterium]
MSLPGSAPRPVPLGRRSALLLALVSLAGLMIFFWPLLIPVNPASQGHATDSPFIFIIILPVLVAIVLAQLSEGGMDSKALAMLGVLSALNAALRPLGAGVNGIETVFFLLILAGWVFGPGFGFVLGCTSMFASALLTAGVGPWLPFQMLTSAWIGMLAGLLPHSIRGRQITGRKEIALLAAFGVVAAYLFGFLMNMWFWPFVTGAAMGDGSGLAYIPGAPILENLHRFIVFTVITSSLGWDTGRAITNAAAIVLLGPSVLLLLRRAVRRANFTAEVRFTTPA